MHPIRSSAIPQIKKVLCKILVLNPCSEYALEWLNHCSFTRGGVKFTQVTASWQYGRCCSIGSAALLKHGTGLCKWLHWSTSCKWEVNGAALANVTPSNLMSENMLQLISRPLLSTPEILFPTYFSPRLHRGRDHTSLWASSTLPLGANPAATAPRTASLSPICDAKRRRFSGILLKISHFLSKDPLPQWFSLPINFCVTCFS